MKLASAEAQEPIEKITRGVTGAIMVRDNAARHDRGAFLNEDQSADELVFTRLFIFTPRFDGMDTMERIAAFELFAIGVFEGSFNPWAHPYSRLLDARATAKFNGVGKSLIGREEEVLFIDLFNSAVRSINAHGQNYRFQRFIFMNTAAKFFQIIAADKTVDDTLWCDDIAQRRKRHAIHNPQ